MLVKLECAVRFIDLPQKVQMGEKNLILGGASQLF